MGSWSEVTDPLENVDSHIEKASPDDYMETAFHRSDRSNMSGMQKVVLKTTDGRRVEAMLDVNTRSVYPSR